MVSSGTEKGGGSPESSSGNTQLMRLVAYAVLPQPVLASKCYRERHSGGWAVEGQKPEMEEARDIQGTGYMLLSNSWLIKELVRTSCNVVTFFFPQPPSASQGRSRRERVQTRRRCCWPVFL